MSKIIWLGSTTLITLGKNVLLTDSITGETISTATVTASVYNESQDVLVGNYSMTPATEQVGRYRSVIPYNESNLAVGDRVRITIFADAGSSRRLTIVMKAVVKARTG